MSRGLLVQRDRLCPLAHTLALIAQLRQHIDEHIPNRFVIIHHQNGLLTYYGETWSGWCGHKRVRGGRQIEGNGGPDSNFRGDRDIAVVLGDNIMGNREAEPTATGFGGDIGIKDVRAAGPPGCRSPDHEW